MVTPAVTVWHYTDWHWQSKMQWQHSDTMCLLCQMVSNYAEIAADLGSKASPLPTITMNKRLHLYSHSHSLWSASDTRIFGYSMFLGRAWGCWGWDASDLSSETLFLSLSLRPLLLSRNWKPTSSLLPTDLLFSFSSFYKPIISDVCICSVCVCVCVCVCACMCACMHVYVCVMKWVYPYVFVNTPGSYEMGCHKYSIKYS